MSDKLEVFEEPIGILKSLSDSSAEMTEWQLAFSCGLVKEYTPKKIVEVGTAAGGTTAVLLNCIHMLGLETEVFSIDLSDKYYRDPSKRSGYLAEECKGLLKNPLCHKMCVGILPDFLEEIGADIDFIILDTMHCMPGELLDFLACLPMLKNGAVVIMHDIILNHLGEDLGAFATKVLLTAAVGDKIESKGDSVGYLSPGIGAFKVTEDTRKYIKDVFSALTITWRYIPDEDQIEKYRNIFSNYYGSDCMEKFEDAVNMNKNTLERMQRRRLERLNKTFKFINELQKKRECIYLWMRCCCCQIEMFIRKLWHRDFRIYCF